jgi:hypothetical protein
VIKTAEEPLIGETIYAIVRELYHPVDLNWIKIRLVSNLIAKLTALPTSALRKSPVLVITMSDESALKALLAPGVVSNDPPAPSAQEADRSPSPMIIPPPPL